MPLYEYKCSTCGSRTETIRSFTRRDELPSCACRGAMLRCVSAPSKTPWSWGDTSFDGFRDRGLGTTIVSKKHRELLMKQKGLREVEDGEVEAEIRTVTAAAEKHDREMETYKKVFKATGSHTAAIDQTFPEIQEVKNG